MILTGCGFHLRGTVELPEAMAQTQLRGVDPRGELAGEIRDVLEDAGAQVVGEGEGAGAVLEIAVNRFERRVASVDAAGKASQYELRYVLEGLLREPGGAAMTSTQRAVTVRLLNFEANVLGAATEEEMLRREMLRDGVRQLVRQLRTALAHGKGPVKQEPPSPDAAPATEEAPAVSPDPAGDAPAPAAPSLP